MKINLSRSTLGVLAVLVMLSQSAWAGEQAMAGQAGPETSADFEALKTEWGEAIETLKGYSANQRDKAVAQGKQTLKAMDARLEAIEARARTQWSELSTETREKRQAALKSLREQRNQLAEWYGGMRHSSAGAWDEVKNGFAAAYDRLSESMGRAIDEFGDGEGDDSEGDDSEGKR